MKKLAIIFAVLIAGSPFVSCKKLKDDIKDLQNQANDLQKQNDTLKDKNAALKDQIDGIANAIGSDEPITATTTFTDDNGATRTVSGTYKFKSSDYSTQSIVNNGNGTYEIYIQRVSDVEAEEGLSVSFTYNPTTKAATDIFVYHRWDNADPYYDYAYYLSGTYTGLTKTVTVESLDLTTGAISLKASVAATSAYTTAYSGYTPNDGQPVSTNFTFAGKLKLFATN